MPIVFIVLIERCRIRPESTVPICLDFGTNNEKFLNDPFYLGLRQKRVSDEEMTEFMDEFMAAMADVFPKLVIQFEVRQLIQVSQIPFDLNHPLRTRISQPIMLFFILQGIETNSLR